MDWKYKFEELRNKVKYQLHSKGLDCITRIESYYESFDVDGSGQLDKVEFEAFTRKWGMFLTTQELTVVFKNFDLNGDKQIHYREFVDALRQDFNEKRISVVKYTYQMLDSEGTGQLGLLDLVSRYNASAHPRVKLREKKLEAIAEEFHEGLAYRAEGDVVTEESFLNYYADVSACMPAEKDEYFIDAVLECWGLSEDTYISPQRVNELEDILYEKVRQRTHGADDEGKTAARVFRHFDVDESGAVTFDEFLQVLEAYGWVFKEAEIGALFSKIDADGSGRLDYAELTKVLALKGSGNNPNVNPVWKLND
jgi:Ca2+-binding EF-hand superfamily protein